MIPAYTRYWFAGIYTLAVGFFMFGDASFDEGFWRLAATIPFLLFAVVPIALLCFLQLHNDAQFIAAVPIGAFGLWAYYDTNYVTRSDPNGSLVYLFVPIWQLIMAMIAVAIIVIGLRLLRNWK